MGEFISAHRAFFRRGPRDRWMSASAPHRAGTLWVNADFNSSQNLVKQAEGGFQNDARDPGNYIGGKIGVGAQIGTNWGISAPVFAAFFRKAHGIDPTEDDMKAMRYATALGIYKQNYWAPIKGDAIKNQNVANVLYDSAVNQGPTKAQKYVKDSLGISSYDVNKINAANPRKLFDDVLAKRKADYHKIGGYAEKSWMDRLDKLKAGVKENSGKTALLIVGVGLVITGIYIYKNR